MSNDESQKSPRFERVDLRDYEYLSRALETTRRKRWVRDNRIAYWGVTGAQLAVSLAAGTVTYLGSKDIKMAAFAGSIVFFMGFTVRARIFEQIEEGRRLLEGSIHYPEGLKALNDVERFPFNELNALLNLANALDRLINQPVISVPSSLINRACGVLVQVGEVEIYKKSLEELDNNLAWNEYSKDNTRFPTKSVHFWTYIHPYKNPEECLAKLTKAVEEILRETREHVAQTSEGSLMLADLAEDFGALSIAKFQEEQGAVSMIPREESSDDKDHD